MVEESPHPMRVAVAIPCFRVREKVLEVIASVPALVTRIYVVDDACPESSGDWVAEKCSDARVKILRHAVNQGVGGAIITAYREAIQEDMEVVVKIDGDGQMDPKLLPLFVKPLCQQRADYTKGNRFFRPSSLNGMPTIRLLGNAGLSFLTKLSCGYWPIMDPTNGYTAVRVRVLKELPLDKIERRYFFETDMLFRLNTLRAVVKDIPMDAIYADEQSSLRVSKVLPEFLYKHINCLFKRYLYAYLLRDFNIGSLYSLAGMLFVLGGAGFGITQWILSAMSGQPATSGTVMLAALPIFIGIQFLIAFLHFDVSNVPNEPLSATLGEELP